MTLTIQPTQDMVNLGQVILVTCIFHCLNIIRQWLLNK